MKFTSDAGDEFYKEFVIEVNRYFSETGKEKTGGGPLLLKFSSLFGISLFSYFAMLNTHHIYVFILLYCFAGMFLLFAAFNLSHDAVHGVAVKSKTWNKILFEASFGLLGYSPFIYKMIHNHSHHQFSNIQGVDYDIIDIFIFRMNANQPLKKVHQYQWMYAPLFYLLYTLYWLFMSDLMVALNLSKKKIELPFLEIIKLVLFKTINLTLFVFIPLLALPFSWPYILLAFLLYHFLMSLTVVTLLGLIHLSDYVIHPLPGNGDKMNLSWASLQMKASLDYSNSNTLFTKWVGGFNAHLVHHLVPHVSHIHFEHIIPILKKSANKHGLHYIQISFVELLRSHFRHLKLMGKQPNNP